MLSLIVIFLFSLVVATIAIENTASVTLRLAGYTLPHIPIYLLVISSILIGIVIAWIISTADTLSTFFAMRNKNQTIIEKQQKISELQKRMDELEEENVHLRQGHIVQEAEMTDTHVEETRHERPAIFDTFWHRLNHW